MLTEDMEVHPCGTSILIEILPVSNTYEGTMIQRADNDTKREEGGRDIGKVIAIGPHAYKDFKVTHQDWGYEIGDTVEFNRYDGKAPRIAETFDKYKNLRFINDNEIIGVYKGAAQ